VTNRRNFLIAGAAAFSFLSPQFLIAAEKLEFSRGAFDDAQNAGKPILIDISAPWCPTCRAQKEALKALLPKHKELVVFDVDFDSQKDVVRAFKASMQSTLITYKGKVEVGRLVGVSDKRSIARLLETTM
jgi:thioredoxin 1